MGAVGELDIGYINPHETNRPEADWQVPCQHPARCECAESRTREARKAGRRGRPGLPEDWCAGRGAASGGGKGVEVGLGGALWDLGQGQGQG